MDRGARVRAARWRGEVSDVADDAGVVGFIGLGIMGKPMARNLLEAGFDLVVHSRSAGPVDEAGRGGGPPRGVARGGRRGVRHARSPCCPTRLTWSPSLFGDAGRAAAIRPGSLAVDMSTISPTRDAGLRRAAGARATSRSWTRRSSGGEKGAIDGALSIMIGGEAEDVARAMPLFEAHGQDDRARRRQRAPARWPRRATSWWSRRRSRRSPRRHARPTGGGGPRTGSRSAPGRVRRSKIMEIAWTAHARRQLPARLPGAPAPEGRAHRAGHGASNTSG